MRALKRILWGILALVGAFLLLTVVLGVSGALDEPEDPYPSSTPTRSHTASPSPSRTLAKPTLSRTPTRAPEPSAPPVTREPVVRATPDPVETSQAPAAEVYYANCGDVRAAGAAPIRRGDPGYSSSLDRDGDGIACES